MKRLSSVISILIVCSVIYWSFTALQPKVSDSKSTNVTDFSLNKALHHLKNISLEAHHVGSDAHKKTQQYIVTELEKLGFSVELQTATVVNKKWFAATSTENIIAKLKGSANNKALLLLSHYDSNPHSSLGASDAGSGVVAILEGIRAFLAQNKTPKNDIIILISDAEELGLLGAKSFVDYHPWVKNVGLVLNFEARGSGGPSYMLMETNGGNSKLIDSFLKANPNFPAANSLMYSIYKKLPNDTDLTVFREEANINGFNFAFIGDHFDYHTAQDSYERLDRASLLHQADYLMTTLNYFAFENLEDLTSADDNVYVNFPFTKLLTYPFSWVNAMLILATFLFLVLLFFGFSLRKLDIKESLKGFLPFLIALIVCTAISYYLWKLILVIHPAYQDILHGFTYNGYTYIAAFTFLTLYITLKIYKYFKVENVANFLVAPITIWLLINVVISLALKGAGFFIIPVYCALFILAIAIFTTIEARNKRILFTIFSIPTLYIFAPMVKMFPVGLGLSKLFISTLIIVLLFGLMVVTFHQKKSSWMLKLSALAFLFFFGKATYNSGFSIDNKKPNSIVYVQDSDKQTALFGTYNKTLDTYTSQIFSKDAKKGSIANAETKSKYNTRFHFYKETDYKNIASSTIQVDFDTIIGDKRIVELVITPTRKVNKYEFITKNKITLQQFKVNDALVNSGKTYTVQKGTFLIYHMGNSDKEVTLSFTLNKQDVFAPILNEISYDLLSNPNFSLTPRTEEMMPMPFVTNDAIIITRELKL